VSAQTGVFLSAVTSEFGKLRQTVRSVLSKQGYDVTSQEDFAQTGGTTLEKLDEYVRTCPAVVSIVGKRSGSLPPAGAAADYARLLPKQLAAATYTQWEVILAHHYDKPLYVYHASDRHVPDEPQPTGEDHPELQAKFTEWLFEGLGLDRTTFDDDKDLQIAVLTTRAVGFRHSADTSKDGLAVEERKTPSYRRKDPADANRLRRNRRPLVGRSDELDDVLAALDGRFEQLTLLVGPKGVGKRSLLHELSQSEELPEHADGAAISPIVRAEANLDDVRQAIWEEFYQPDDSSLVVPERQRIRDLQSIESLIFIPEIDGLVDSIASVLEDMSGSDFCCSVSEDLIDAIDDAIPSREDMEIDGLLDGEMLELFSQLYRAEIPADAIDDVLALCKAEGGNPAEIEVLATTARREAKAPRSPDEVSPLIDWAAERRGAGSPDVLVASPPSAEYLDVVATTKVVGTEVPHDVIATTPEAEQALNEALDDGAVQEGSPRYRLSPVLAAVESGDGGVLGADELMEEVFDRSLNWVGKATHSSVFENRDFVVRMLDWGVKSGKSLLHSGDMVAAHERFNDVIDLGREAEPAIATGARHGAWAQVLDGVEEAAEADVALARSVPSDAITRDVDRPRRTSIISAEDALGWVSHERGSRALLRDDLSEARVQFNDALRRRVSEPGRELARANLLQVPFGVVPYSALLMLIPFAIALALPVLFPFNDKIAVADVTPDSLQFVDGQQFDSALVTNVGEGQLWVDDFAVAASEHEKIDDVGAEQEGWVEGFRIDPVRQDRDSACKKPQVLETGESCRIHVESTVKVGHAVLLIEFTSGTTKEALGDRAVVVIARPADPDAGD
jgi:hypothetical protein